MPHQPGRQVYMLLEQLSALQQSVRLLLLL